jgi:hypothetical protein
MTAAGKSSPNSAPPPLAIVPAREPDFCAPPSSDGCTAEFWLPTPTELGVVRVEERDGDSPSAHSDLCTDVRSITRMLERPTILSPLYRYLGATLVCTNTPNLDTTTLTLSHPEFLNDHGRALPLPNDHRLPSFLGFAGTEFEAEDAEDALLHEDSFLVGMEEDYLVHDWSHILGGLILLSPKNVERLKDRFRQANPDDRREIAAILRDIDQNAQWDMLASRTASALILDAGLPPMHSRQLHHHTEQIRAWSSAGALLQQLLFGNQPKMESYDLGLELQAHCYALGRAALTATQAGART